MTTSFGRIKVEDKENKKTNLPIKKEKNALDLKV